MLLEKTQLTGKGESRGRGGNWPTRFRTSCDNMPFHGDAWYCAPRVVSTAGLKMMASPNRDTTKSTEGKPNGANDIRALIRETMVEVLRSSSNLAGKPPLGTMNAVVSGTGVSSECSNMASGERGGQGLGGGGASIGHTTKG